MPGVAVPDSVEFDALVDLLEEWFPRLAVARVECRIVTVGTSSRALGPVAVRTGESGIEHDLLKPFAVKLPEISCI